MPGPFVADNSVIAAWCFEDEASVYADEVLDALPDAGARVPSLWPLELANALLVGERRRRLTRAQTGEALALIAALPITVVQEPAGRAVVEILELARLQGLSAYDASYLDLAMREQLALATQDKPLRRAAARLGVPLFGIAR